MAAQALRLLMDSCRLRHYEVDSLGAPIAVQAEHLVYSELGADILSVWLGSAVSLVSLGA